MACTKEERIVEPSTMPTVNLESNIEIIDPSALKRINENQVIPINKIQGESHISPYIRKNISDLFGVVTFKRADGFYMQSAIPDSYPETSEGIFIFTNLPPKVLIGDWVLVDGVVSEFYPGGLETGNLSITQIEKPVIKIVTRENNVPPPIIIGENGRIPPDKVIEDDGKKIFDMQDGLDFYESMESMLVQVNNAVCVSASTSYKEFAVVGDKGKYSSGRNFRGGLTISPEDFNPERIIIDDSFTSVPIVTLGDYFEDPIVGILDYTFGNFKLQPINKINVTKNSVEKEIADKRKDGTLTIASLNLENLDPNDSPDRFIRLADIIVNNLLSPEIIALQEIQDNNGPINDGETAANLTYELIIESIIGVGGPEYQYTDIPPLNNKDGGEPGGNIRVGFLYEKNVNLKLSPGSKGKSDEAVQVIGSGNDLNLNSKSCENRT